MKLLSRLNDRPAAQRWPLKIAAAAALALVVLFPRLDRVPTWISRHMDPEALVRPDAPELRPLIEEFDGLRAADWDDARLLKEIESFVHRKVPYEWDWILWGNADYFPTVAETLERGREDCDGRAIVAASLLRHYAYDAHLAGDIMHLWVVTERGATMGPNPIAGVQFTPQGRRINWAVLQTLPKAVSFGIAVFPLGRELILTVGLWLLLLRGRVPPVRLLGWVLLACFGLMLVREGGRSSAGAALLKQWIGLACICATIMGMIVQQRRGGRVGEGSGC